MQFITTDQRIAVENFEIGLIYTVNFTSGSYFLGACIGIGRDYVMFQRTAPELIFSLTMATASDVASIEPLPQDIGQILEYTGSVPVSIKTDGSPLLDYLITGNTIQNGTPTPDNPIVPEGCGDLETVGAKAGQYKLPISSASTTTNIYLGEVPTTRKIKKLVLDGTEDGWREGTGFFYNQQISSNYKRSAGNITLMCTHFQPYKQVSQGGEVPNGYCSFYYDPAFQRLYIVYNSITSLADFKAWLAQQYANGTPVTVWYVLATEETAVVNEPLMRIGDYADTLSYRQSGVNVPTSDGLDIFDIDTTVKPSKVYLKYFSPLL